MWHSFETPQYPIGLLKYWSTDCHSQEGMGVSLWDPSELSLHDHTGVLLQYAWIRLFHTLFPYYCSRYLYSSHFGAVATPGILSRVFLFHFEKISGHFNLFQVFRDVSVNIGRNSRFDRHEVCALKKKFLKPKQICILYTKKPQKEKKNEKKINEQR